MSTDDTDKRAANADAKGDDPEDDDSLGDDDDDDEEEEEEEEDPPASRRRGASKYIDNEAAESDCEDDPTAGGGGKRRKIEKKPKDPLVWQSMRATVRGAAGAGSILLELDCEIYNPNNQKCTTRRARAAAPRPMFPFHAPWMTYMLQPTSKCPPPEGTSRQAIESVPLTRENFKVACVVATGAETRRLDVGHVLDELKKRYPRETIGSLDQSMQRIYKQRALIPIDALRSVDDFCKLSHPILITRAWEIWGRSLRPKEYYILLYALQWDPAIGDAYLRTRLATDVQVSKLWNALTSPSGAERRALSFTLDETFNIGAGINPALFPPHERRGPFLSEEERDLYKIWESCIRAPWINEGVLSPVLHEGMQALLDVQLVVLAEGGRVVPTYLRNEYTALFALVGLPHVRVISTGCGTLSVASAFSELRHMCNADNVEMPASSALVILECTHRRAIRPDAAPGLEHAHYDDFFSTFKQHPGPLQAGGKRAIIVLDAHHLSRSQLMCLTKVPHDVRVIVCGLQSARPTLLPRMIARFETPGMGRAAYLNNVFEYIIEKLGIPSASERQNAPEIYTRTHVSGTRSWTDALRDMPDGGRNLPVLCDTWETCVRARRDALQAWYTREEQTQYNVGEWVIDNEGCRARLKSLYREESGGSKTYIKSVACDDPRNEYSLFFALDYDKEPRRFRAGGAPPEFKKMAITTAAEQRFMPEDVVVLLIGSWDAEHPYYDYTTAGALARKKLIVIKWEEVARPAEEATATGVEEKSLINQHF
jgi:hypothetical protein